MILILLLVALACYVVWFYWNRQQYPPGPLPLPFVGNLLQLRDKEIALWCDELTKLYGPVFTIYLPSPHVVLATFDAIKEATVVKGHHFGPYEFHWGSEHFSKKNIDPPFEYISYAPNTGIFGNNGESWRQQRRMFLSVLSEFGMDKAAIETSTMLAVRNLTDHLNAIGDKAPVDMPTLLLWYLANATNHLLFGYMFKDMDDFSRFNALIMDVISEFDTWETRLMRQLPWLKNWPIISSGYKRANAKKAR
ncbi:Protein CYP-14A3, partial [Aphelenchoides avenae]